MREQVLKISYLDISEIKEYKNNSKEHPEWQIIQISNSIEKFGFNDPIAIDENNTIIEGHGRYLAAKKLGLNKIPCIQLKDLKEEEKKAYIIAHNKLTMNTDFNLEKLKIELSVLENYDFDLELTGFSLDEIEDIQIDIPDEVNIPSDEEEEEGESTNLPTLSFGKIKCRLTTEELDELMELYNLYVEREKTDYGFISFLLEGR